VRAEAVAVFGTSPANDKARVPSREAVDGMPTTLAALKEALRLYSVVPVVTRVTVVRPQGGIAFAVDLTPFAGG